MLNACPCVLCYHDAERTRRAARWLAALLGAMIFVAGAVGLANGAEAPPDSVVLVGDGCSGVCVDPAGVFLTVKHCQHGEREPVRFPDGTRVTARKVYESKETDGPVVLIAESGDVFPSSPLANTPPKVGDRVYSWGFPAGAQSHARNLTYADGVVSGGREFSAAEVGLLHLGPLAKPYRANVVEGMAIDGGWSGGPLFNEAGEVCGLASASDKKESVWIPYTVTRDAYTIAVANVSPRTVEYWTQPGCVPCARFEDDKHARAFPGYRFVPATDELPADAEGTPAFRFLGEVTAGYTGAGDLTRWLHTVELRSSPSRERPPPAYAEDETRPEPRPTTPNPIVSTLRAEIAEARSIIERCVTDLREFQEAGALGKLRQIDDLKADAADAKALAANASARIDAVRSDYARATEDHPWYYGVPAVIVGILKRRFANRGPEVVEV